MVTDRLTDRMGLEPILSINVNLMQTQTGIETVRVNEPSGAREKFVPKNFGTSCRYSEKKTDRKRILPVMFLREMSSEEKLRFIYSGAKATSVLYGFTENAI